nr:unknown [Pieris rapae granulovirus]AGS18849.1 hypothetical protein [Pieris rapae granulovirus]
MNFDFLKDLVGLNPIKTTHVSNNLRTNFNFIVNDYVKEKNCNKNNVTLLQKLHKIFNMFLNDELDRELVYNLFGNKLDLTKKQFYYLYEKIKNDIYINNLLNKICDTMDNNSYSPEQMKQHLLHSIEDENGFANLSSFLLRECNSAAKIK